MERGPLPPHERTWRHPSELAAEERTVLRAEAAAPTTRMFALTTGTLGLLAVGMLIFTVTPRRQESPIAISATTTPIFPVAVAAAPGSSSGTQDSGRPSALAPAFSARGPFTAMPAPTQHALATPIGDGHLALITNVALAEHGTNSLNDPEIDVRLPSGHVGSGTIIEQSGDTWLIELQQPEAGHGIAARQPVGAEIVTVMDSPPVTIAFADVATLDVPEGAAVLDHAGDLVGLCTRTQGDGKVRVIEIRAEHAGATSDAP